MIRTILLTRYVWRKSWRAPAWRYHWWRCSWWYWNHSIYRHAWRWSVNHSWRRTHSRSRRIGHVYLDFDVTKYLIYDQLTFANFAKYFTAIQII